MAEKLTSVGLDIGTTSTQMIVSELTIENQASSFAVPELTIADRKILYRSPVHFTPLLDAHRMDAPALGKLIREEYEKAGLRREDVDTGAVIITGETSRKENARAVLGEIADLAGDFVVAAAGPDLESALAAKGSGAESYCAQTGKTVLHMDIGGGTSNLALIREGKITATGCLNVGGRLVKLTKAGEITYVSPVLNGLTDLRVGEHLTRERAIEVCQMLTRALEMAAGLREQDALLAALTTGGTAALPLPGTREEKLTLSFSGGVADCIAGDRPWLEFGDLGPTLGECIRESRLCGGGVPCGNGDHPCHGHRRRVPQRPAFRQYGVQPEYDLSPEKHTGGASVGPGAGAGSADSKGAYHAGWAWGTGPAWHPEPRLPAGHGPRGGNCRWGPGGAGVCVPGGGHGSGPGAEPGRPLGPPAAHPVSGPGEADPGGLPGCWRPCGARYPGSS